MADLVGRRVSVLAATGGTISARAAKAATATRLHADGVVSLHLRTLAREGRMTVIIGRRELLVALGGAAVSWPIAARAAGPRPRIAVLSINSEQDERKNVVAFVDGLRALGYVTSQNVDIDYRYAEGDTTRLKPLAQVAARLPTIMAYPEVAEWLSSIGLSEYAQRFADNAIDLSALRDLTEQDLKDVGVSS
jgi:hypothetical protein